MRRTELAAVALVAGALAATPVSRGIARAATVDGSSRARRIAAAPPVGLDACALLTSQEAAAALGGTVKQPKATRTIASSLGPGIETAVSACSYETATKHMTLSVRRTTDAAAGRLRQMVQMVCGKKQAVPGVGEVACWYSQAHDELQVVEGATFLSVELKGAGDVGEAIKNVAKKALARVPR
jgi:hypothetical protein